MSAHAYLSPSSASRWMTCTASPRLEASVPDSGSDFAKEGTLAHAYCARALKQYLGQSVEKEDEEIEALSEFLTPEMPDHVATYVDYVLCRLTEAKKLCQYAQLLVEERLSFAHYVPNSFGTADAIIVYDGRLEVIDFKYGSGVAVEVEGNPQLRIYALGAHLRFLDDYTMGKITMTIVQPRNGGISSTELSGLELAKWAAEELAPKAREAYDGGGKQVPGDHCRFCKVKATCRALAEMATAAAAVSPETLTIDELAKQVLPQIATIKNWVSAVETYALNCALAGETIPGYKVVEGISRRIITDPAGVVKALAKEGYDEAELYRPAEIRPLGELEKMAGKKVFNELCSPFIAKPAGKPALVPESDKRPPFNKAKDDFSHINNS